jgi:3-deoxy-D-manno-octulosonate 8-phosphate phosphatase (KDO 8-P phosphatase)
MAQQYKNFIFDVDGVLTDGKFHYSVDGKVMKAFGSDDADALQLIKHRINIVFVTGDWRGYAITCKRMEDMGFITNIVSTHERLAWIKERYNPEETIYVGDGIFDSLVMEGVAIGIAPANAFHLTKNAAKVRLTNKGGEGAVAEAVCWYVESILGIEFDVEQLLKDKKDYEENNK